MITLPVWLFALGFLIAIIVMKVIDYVVEIGPLRADRDHWRKEVKVAHGHLQELDDAITARCEHFRKGMHWCDRYDCFAECSSCFVQGNDGVARKEEME